MRCSTCGENLETGQARCPTCGATTPSVGRVVPVARSSSLGVKRCPRCGYQGEGISYFSRPGHVGLLVGVSLFTYGLGGVVYWLARRRHRVCPNCGLGWHNAGQPLLSPAAEAAPPPTKWEEPAKLPSSGIKRRVLGSVMILVASFLMMMGIIEFIVPAFLTGLVLGGGGTGTFFWGLKAAQERRQALTTGLERKVLWLATEKGGTLTVTEVAADLNLSISVAEDILIGMDDGFRVRSDITDEGILLYEFPEVQHRKQLERPS